jgi:hypothetical protein
VRGALRVPEITIYFWVIKALSTAMGESTSGYLVHAIDPVVAVAIGFVGFCGALVLQFSMRRYLAWTYWLAVVGVGVFGTMAADVLHVRFGVPYAASTVLYAAVLLAVFIAWQQTEGTLSIHTVDTPRREAFYWAVVVATFAMGTALGDLTATTFHLGYFGSGLRFAVRRRHRDPGTRLLAPWLERDLLVLVRLRRDPATRRLVRRLDGQTPKRGRPRLGRRPSRPRADRRHLVPCHLPRPHPQRPPARRSIASFLTEGRPCTRRTVALSANPRPACCWVWRIAAAATGCRMLAVADVSRGSQ